MGGKVLEHEAKTIRNEGLAVGREEGLLAGRKEGLLVGREEGMILSAKIFQATKRRPEAADEQIAEEVGCTAEEVQNTRKMFGV